MSSSSSISFVPVSPLFSSTLASSKSYSSTFTSSQKHRRFWVPRSHSNTQTCIRNIISNDESSSNPSSQSSSSLSPALSSTTEEKSKHSYEGPSNQASRLQFPSLRSESFRHPVDVRASRLLRLFFGVEPIIRRLLETVEQTFLFENLSSGIKVSSKQYSSINNKLEEACKILDIKKPDLYIRQNPVPNAYTLAIQGKQPFIVIHSSLIDLLTIEELQAVIAHELGHLKSEHGLLITIANLMSLFLPKPISDNFNLQLLIWLRSAELTCDRAMLLVVQDLNIAISTLMKLTGGSIKYSSEMNIDEFINQIDIFEKASNTWFGKRIKDSIISSTTHPLPILRVKELKRWSESNHYRSIMKSGSSLSTSDTSSTT